MEDVIPRLDLQQPGIWFPLSIAVSLLAFMIFMPKRQINWQGIYFTFGVVGYVGLMLDINILGSYLDWFDLGDSQKEGLGDLASYGLIPSCMAIIYLNYFNRQTKWSFVGLFTLLSFLYEWELTNIGYMKLKGWQDWYSIPLFILVYGVWLPWHFEMLQRTCAGTITQSTRSNSLGMGLRPTQPALKKLDDRQDGENRS